MIKDVERLRLNSPKNTRLTIARYLRQIQREDEDVIDFRKYKLILDFLKEYRAMFQFEKDASIEKRLAALEEKI